MEGHVLASAAPRAPPSDISIQKPGCRPAIPTNPVEPIYLILIHRHGYF
jgi:hypothetical protein